MKVKDESVNVKHKPLSGRCDFCSFYAAEHTVNGGLWWVCKACMDSIYSECHCTEDYQAHHMSYCKYADEASAGEEE